MRVDSFWRSKILWKVKGKSLLCRNHRKSSVARLDTFEKFGNLRTDSKISVESFSANTHQSKFKAVPPNRKPRSAPVKACVPCLGVGWHSYTFEGVKRGLRPLWAFVRERGFLLEI